MQIQFGRWQIAVMLLWPMSIYTRNDVARGTGLTSYLVWKCSVHGIRLGWDGGGGGCSMFFVCGLIHSWAGWFLGGGEVGVLIRFRTLQWRGVRVRSVRCTGNHPFGVRTHAQFVCASSQLISIRQNGIRKYVCMCIVVYAICPFDINIFARRVGIA